MKQLWTALVLVVASLTVTAQDAMRLLYISSRGNGFDIYSNNIDGTDEQKLTQNPGWDWSPQWNEKRKGVIYNSMDEAKHFSIKMMDATGNAMPINTHGLEEYILSPNGKRVLYTKKEGDFTQIYLAKGNGKKAKKITDTPSYNGRARWAPDSKQIVFISDRDGNNEVYWYNVKTKEAKRLTNNDTNEKYLTWSPDGKKIAYTTQYYEEGKPDRNDIFILNLATMQTTQLTDNLYDDAEIAWSPDGTWIAFHSKREGEDHIYIIRPDGSDERKVTSVSAYHGEPAWVPSKR